MRKYILLVLGLVFLSACFNAKCPIDMFSPSDCEFGTYTKTEDGCTLVRCRPTPDFNCDFLEEGDSYHDYDNCKICYCQNNNEICTRSYCSPEGRLNGEGEMCGGIAGFQCMEGFRCELKGDYPDASGFCVKEDCPHLVPPAPDFCLDGEIVSVFQDGCISGYKCISGESDAYSCKQDTDCEIKNIGNCCGYYPVCVNRDFQPDPEAVQRECMEKNMVSVCGFPSIAYCECIEGRCVGKS